jgi:hypothetical protein
MISPAQVSGWATFVNSRRLPLHASGNHPTILKIKFVCMNSGAISMRINSLEYWTTLRKDGARQLNADVPPSFPKINPDEVRKTGVGLDPLHTRLWNVG